MIRALRPLYVMIKPPLAVARQIHALGLCDPRRDVGLLHMTILFLWDAADLSPRMIDILAARLSGVRFAPFRVAFDRVAGNGRSVALVPGEALERAMMFKHAVVAAMAAGTAFSREPALRPHITLDYRRGPKCSAAIDPISWTVEEFVLIESVHGEGRHIERGRWRLDAPALMPDAELPMRAA